MILISILAHDNLTLTKAAIKSALAQDTPIQLVVVDNSSTDGTPQWLATQRDLSTILFAERKSVAACWNYVLEWAFAPTNPAQYEGVLVLNNDVEIRPDTVKWMMANPAPFVTAISVRTREELNYPAPPTTERPHPDFSCFAIKPECWNKVGRMDEGFEIAFCEDNDYHVRMHRAGVRAVGIDLPFLHHGSQTVKRADPVEARMIQRQSDRNRDRFRKIYGCGVSGEEYEALFLSRP